MTTDNERLPIEQLCDLQKSINAAIDTGKWKRTQKLARSFIKLIPQAVDKKTCRTGKPHLDGIYVIGTIRYDGAPIEAVKALNLMNRLIKSAKKSLKK